MYPTAASVHGGAAIVPLSRQRFIDGDTTQPGLNGAAGAPFKTIAQFTAARAPTSILDATANFVGWLTPAESGYTETVSFPAYASTELRADSISLVSGTIITGNLEWVNQAGAFTGLAAVVAVHNIFANGNFTVTDDANAPLSAVIFGGDEVGRQSALLTGEFNASATTKLSSVSFTNATIQTGVSCGVATSSARVMFDNCAISGSVTAKGVTARLTTFNLLSILTNDTEVSTFADCQFTSATSLTALSYAQFDGVSWSSFVGAGGTRTAGTVVLVTGGYNGAAVEGAALPTGGVNTNVSLNGSGASAGYTGSDSGNHFSSAGLAADGASVTLIVGGGELGGDTILITKTDLAAHALDVKNGAGVTIGVIPSGERGFVLARFDSGISQWVFSAGGSLAA